MPERNLDFDKVIDRSNTSCIKHDFKAENNMPEDVLPLWVADMDFKTSSYIEDALAERAKHAVFGYSDTKGDYFEALSEWMKNRHNWDIKENWLVKTPGIVFALATAVRAYTEKGDAVLLQSPVYYPFAGVIKSNGRRVVSSDLCLGGDNRYHMNFEDFEQKIVSEKIKLFLLCSPHNPVGRVWTNEELLKVGEICLKHGVTVVSDEIHNDFVWEGEHTVFSNVKKEFEEMSVICTAPSKTFNIAGLPNSNIFIPNPELRRKFNREFEATGSGSGGIMGMTACEAAYRNGGEWYEAMCAYVKGNIDFAEKYVKENIPQIKMIKPEGTYLIWLDCRELALKHDELEDFIVNKAQLWLDSGSMFGDNGEGFQRVNAACSRKVLEEGLERLKRAVESL